jgi:hypothetical protein
VIPLSLGHLHAGDAFGRIVLAHGRDGGLQQAANSFQPPALGGPALDRGQHSYDMVATQQRDALITMLGTKAFDHAPAVLLGVGRELPPGV